MAGKEKQKILIVDDSEMNRLILSDILEEEFEILEAEDGEEGIMILQKRNMEISLVLLDIVMPGMDGFGVLEVMNQNRWIKDIPVVMISAENSTDYIARAYELGVTDFISRPFDSSVVYRRVNNTIMLYAKQKKLATMVADQIYETEKRSGLLVSILSHIVEFRNGESGMHVIHVQALTELLLRSLARKTDKYNLTPAQISLISVTSALHDIGKIGIPDQVLNKPGKLTDEEFAIMKTHSQLGASMLEAIPFYKDEELVKVAIDICQSHHERYDGRGYPNGLVGEEIPIAAQVVALADVYDALTSERVYKKAFSHEKAIDMILHGECGAFNPLIMECLRDNEEEVRKVMDNETLGSSLDKEFYHISDSIADREELSAVDKAMRLLEYERKKNEFYAEMSKEIQFEYIAAPPLLTVSAWGAKVLGISENILNPMEDESLGNCFGKENIQKLIECLEQTSPENPIVQLDFEMTQAGEARWKRVVAQTIWSSEGSEGVGSFVKFYGKITDIHEEYVELSILKQMSSRDGLTGLYNRAAATEMMVERMQKNPDHSFAFIMFDIDDFKSANDQYGHIFGDSVLKYVADKLTQSIRSSDIAARIGGDEFMLFLEYRTSLEMVVERIFTAINSMFNEFSVSISMGIAKSDDVGTDYTQLYHCADCALYTAKKGGKGRYYFYDETMKDTSLATSQNKEEEEKVRE